MNVSIIMVSNNNENEINKTIESILSQKTQYDVYIELIIVDENSNDGTKDIIKEYQKTFDEIKLIENKRQFGLNNSRNIGIKNSIGDFIGFAEANENWNENKLDLQLKTLNKYNKSILCFTDYIFSTNRNSSHFENQKYFKKMLKNNSIYQNCTNIFSVIIKEDIIDLSTVLIRKSILTKNLMFNSKLDKKDDWDFLLKLATKGSFSFVNKVMVTKNNTEFSEFNDLIHILEHYKDKCNERTYKIAKSNCYARMGDNYFGLKQKKDASIFYYKSMKAFFQFNIFRNYFFKILN